MFNMSKIRKLQQVAQNPRESSLVQGLVTIITELEDRQLSAVEELHDAVGIEGVDRVKDKDERREQLLDVADAAASGEFTAWWFETVASEHVENPEDAAAYADLSDEEWADQIGRWADSYRSRAPGEFVDATDREIADEHVGRKFGVSLDEFEREVVGYDRNEALRSVLAGNFEAVESGIQAASAAARQDGETDE